MTFSTPTSTSITTLENGGGGEMGKKQRPMTA